MRSNEGRLKFVQWDFRQNPHSVTTTVGSLTSSISTLPFLNKI
jgi:hypothetical protein